MATNCVEDTNEAEQFDVIIVGAGIIGSACAYYAVKSGLKTLLFEQYELGHDHGSSHGASRIIRHTHSSEVYLPLSVDAFDEWNQLEKEFHRTLYSRNGLLWLSDDLARTLQRAALLQKYSIPHTVLKGSEIEKQFCHLQYNDADNWSAVWEPSGGTLLADRCLGAFHEQLQASPLCIVRQNERVIDINADFDGYVRVKTASSDVFTAQKIVVAVGPWLSKLIGDLPLHVSPQRVAVNYWKIKESAQHHFNSAQASPNLIITQRTGLEAYMIPCVDYADKVKFGIHKALGEMDPDRPSETNTDLITSFNRILSDHLTEHIKDLDASKPIFEDRCYYTTTDDHDFILDVHPQHVNVIIAGGMSGTGFKFAPTIGKMVTRVLTAHDNGTTAAELFPDAFKLSRQIAEKDECKL